MKLSEEDKERLATIVLRVADVNEDEFTPSVKVSVSDAVVSFRCANEQKDFTLVELDEAEEYLTALIDEARRVGFSRKAIREKANNLLQTIDGVAVDFEHIRVYEDVLDEIYGKLCAYIRPVEVKNNEEDDF